jgi:hypothetical protein
MPAAMLILLSACSDGVHEDKSDAARIVPEGLTVTALAGGNGVLDVTALTLRRGASSTEVYAALKNDGEIPACTAAFSIELFDQTDRSLAAGIGGLLTQHLYRLRDGSGSIAACVGPGDVTIAAVTDLPADIVVDEVKTIVYRSPYYALDVDPIEGLDIDDMKSVSRDGATAYTGTLVNDLDVAVSKPSVTVFPVNRVGRPLGMALGSSTHEIPPRGRWTFETSSVDAAAVDSAAYPTGAIHP